MNVRSPIFRKLLLSAFLPAAVTLAVLDFYLTRFIAQQQVENAEQRLSLQARLLVSEAARVAPDQLQSWAASMGSRTETRVTVIDSRGVVLADSEHDPETMENHASRPEVIEARRRGLGASLRHSRTLNRDLCYVAVAFAYRGAPGSILRLAVPLRDLDRAIAEVRRRVIGASLLAAVLALFIAYLFARSFTARITRLRAFADALAGARLAPLPFNAGDDELGSLARSLDRTARELNRLIERLSFESARNEAILSSMVEGVVAVDSQLRVIFSNRAFARLAAHGHPIPTGMPLLEVVRDSNLQDVLRDVLESQQSSRRKLQLPAAAGRLFEVQTAPLVGPAERGALAILHDVTELERLERVRKDFVANVSHELRTPLTAIQGYAETLLEGALEDRENNRRFVEVIRSHAARLNHIASDLLILSELESGPASREGEAVSVRAALEAALESVQPEAEQRGVKLVRGVVEEAEISGSRMRLEQALVNLLNNGVKFNRAGGEVRVEVRRTAGERVTISVSDTGIGIPSEDLQRIFERFYRVDKARSREVGGTGLGLSIVKHVVERMGGAVTVESEMGRGSTFRMVLPLRAPLDGIG